MEQMPSLMRQATKTLAPDPLARKFLDCYKDHGTTAYHSADTDVFEDVESATSSLAATLQRKATFRPGNLPKAHVVTQVDPRDENSPDNWVPRNPDLLRLTGKHPINAEPNVTTLLDQGFITPVSLHYVRNHGKTPKIERNNHRLQVGGLVEHELDLSMDDLERKFQTVSIPITICCSGNRRKEHNVVRKTVGFNWSSSAHSCNMWTGVRLADVLTRAGVDMERARFVWLDGAGEEGLPNGTYGTSVDILTATNPFDHILLAWNQNGIPLHPDHGFPLRCVVPGMVGGRAVKWLQRVWVADRPSENFYHFHDNRIMPSFVDAQLATEEGWWYREEYIYNELNVNSTIVYPSHQQSFNLPARQEEFLVRGFAFSGGGRKVTRVELTLDEGRTWRLCKVDYPEERYSSAPKYGKYYAWMFFELPVPLDDLVALARNNGEIRSRAWDTSNNNQPLEFSWNVLGMGNNSQYRVKLVVRKEHGCEYVEFLHPVAEGGGQTGWMRIQQEQNSQGKSLLQRKIDARPTGKSYSAAEVAKHNTASDCWIIMDGAVFNVTKYLKHHPGGASSIVMNAGMDASSDFHDIHSDKARVLLEKFYIGDVDASGESATSEEEPAADSAGLHKMQWREFELTDIVQITPDSRLYSFKLQTPETPLGLPCGHHMILQAPTLTGKSIVRPYTPVSGDDDLGKFVLCVKTYFPDSHPMFPEGGKMSMHLEDLKVGQIVKARGPLGHFEYVGNGRVVLNGVERNVKQIGMICGGTGLTPAYQVLQKIYKDKSDKTVVKLLYANRSDRDILMKEELLKFCERDNIHVWLTVSTAPQGWTMDVGHVDEAMIKKHTPPASNECVVGLCGPPTMITDTCIPVLTKLGFKDENIIVF